VPHETVTTAGNSKHKTERKIARTGELGERPVRNDAVM
jgi:hypothetical protein